MSAFPLSLVDLDAVMVPAVSLPDGAWSHGNDQEDSAFPLWRAEISRLALQLHALGHELTWLSVSGIYAVTPSRIWGYKEKT